jgi:hypothetical protein
VYQRPPDFAERRVQFNLPKNSKEYSSMPWSWIRFTLSFKPGSAYRRLHNMKFCRI